jgi:hypothetical protein
MKRPLERGFCAALIAGWALVGCAGNDGQTEPVGSAAATSGAGGSDASGPASTSAQGGGPTSSSASGAGGGMGGAGGPNEGCGDGDCAVDEAKAGDCCQDCGCPDGSWCEPMRGACVPLPECGDMLCNGAETPEDCCQDCGCAQMGESCQMNQCQPSPQCGDAQCNGAESQMDCCQDCGCPSGLSCVTGKCISVPSCGDKKCSMEESSSSCCIDCPCPPGQSCKNNVCVKDPYCGDGTCNGGETQATCCKDCGCAKGSSCKNNVCVKDPYCGDGTCNGGETQATCCKDCGCAKGSSCKNNVCVKDPYCGDGTCSGGETQASCCKDCGCAKGSSCKNNVCVKDPYCGDAVCNGKETAASCCKDCGCPPGYACGPKGCTLGDWYFVTTTWTGGSTPPRSVRGQGSFDAQSVLTLGAWEDSNGGSGAGDDFVVSPATDGSVTLVGDNGHAEGSITSGFDFIALTHTTKTSQTLLVRKGSGLGPGKLAGAYRVVAIVGQKQAEWLTGFDGTLSFDAQGCIVPSASSGKTSTGVSVSFKKTCMTVTANGEATLPIETAASKAVWRGWMGMGGATLVLTREVGGAFLAGTIVFVKQATGHGDAKVSGSYGVSHLVYNNANDTAFGVRGAVALDGAGKVTGGNVQTSLGATLGIVGQSYEVGASGGFAATFQDSNSFVGHQAGQAGPFGTGTAQLVVSHQAASADPSAAPTTGSLLVLVRRAVNPAKCGDKTCAGGETSASCCADCTCPTGYACQNGACAKTPTCGDGLCNGKETQASCCKDCGCESGMSCESNGCKSVPSTCTSVDFQITSLWPPLVPLYTACGYSAAATFMEVCTQTYGCAATPVGGGPGAYVNVPVPFGQSEPITVSCCVMDTLGCLDLACDVDPQIQGESCKCVGYSDVLVASSCGTQYLVGCGE